LFIDIDDFKKVNDTYGHYIGDKVLHQTAQVVTKNLRSNDIIGRWGGEEFLVVVNIDNIKNFSMIAEKLRSAIGSILFNSEQDSFNVTVSIGGTMYQENDTVESIVNRADTLMYQAKKTGKNRSVIK